MYGQDWTKDTHVEGWDEEAPAADSWQGVSSKANGTVWEKKGSPNTTQINKTAVKSIYYP